MLLEPSLATECEYEHGNGKLVLRFERKRFKYAAANSEEKVEAANFDTTEQLKKLSTVAVRSPKPGIFHHTHPLYQSPISLVNTNVKKGQALGYLEIDSVFSDVTAPFDGILGLPLTENGCMAGYGQNLFEIMGTIAVGASPGLG